MIDCIFGGGATEHHPLILFLGLQTDLSGFLDDARAAMIIGDRERTLAALRNAEALILEYPEFFGDA